MLLGRILPCGQIQRSPSDLILAIHIGTSKYRKILIVTRRRNMSLEQHTRETKSSILLFTTIGDTNPTKSHYNGHPATILGGVIQSNT